MGDYRRRRIEPDEPKSGGGLPIFPLIVLVIFAGLLLGGGLAKFLGRGGGTPAGPTPVPTITPLPTLAATTTPSPAPTPSRSPRPTPSSTPTGKPSATPSPSASPTASPAKAATATPSPKPTTASTVLIITPAPKATAKPVEHATERPPAPPTPVPTLKPTPTPAPALITGAPTAEHAAAIVRSYLTALANGESSFATGYLKTGLPSEDFMKGGRVTNVQATANGDGSFFVTAAMQTPAGSFTENFRLENGPNGLQITEHSPSVTH